MLVFEDAIAALHLIDAAASAFARAFGGREPGGELGEEREGRARPAETREFVNSVAVIRLAEGVAERKVAVGTRVGGEQAGVGLEIETREVFGGIRKPLGRSQGQGREEIAGRAFEDVEFGGGVQDVATVGKAEREVEAFVVVEGFVLVEGRDLTKEPAVEFGGEVEFARGRGRLDVGLLGRAADGRAGDPAGGGALGEVEDRGFVDEGAVEDPTRAIEDVFAGGGEGAGGKGLAAFLVGL